MTLKDVVEEECGKLDENTKLLQFTVNCDYQETPENGDEDDEPELPMV
eukprot:CAMPEP_0201579332 /NCGR_PEP_ID=MMETSP0190_2-20130828/26855_1 /ASSEMBLY_ACC=CAM_ASM_000263 /TAXON_ID=37353 /ORGANISM="Rosalina sp." /LENGTH=47 /DNA_ID= /DNA_START= /DNA_END= /DNA_ORIENTATION=